MSLEVLGREVSELEFDALRAHVDGLAEDVLWKVVREMQQIVAEDVQSARSLLLEHPTLAMAVLRAQIRLGLNISQSIREAGPALRAQILSMSAAPPQAPPPPAIAPSQQPTRSTHHMHPPAPPPPPPMVEHAPTPYRAGCGPPPPPPPPPAAQSAAQQTHAVAAGAHHRAMLDQLRMLTPEQLHALPPAQREQIRSLLAQHHEPA